MGEETVNKLPEEGRKNDQGKIRYELIPPSTLEALATILTFGAQKYAARNWEKGFAWSRAFGALMRHLWAWWDGESLDPETAHSHLWHAQCELSFLIEFEKSRREYDDRPRPYRGTKEVKSEDKINYRKFTGVEYDPSELRGINEKCGYDRASHEQSNDRRGATP